VRHVLCKVLLLLRMHRPDCEHCADLQECCGDEMRKRLEELRLQETSKAEPPKSGTVGKVA
jgi:hypothetical protein